MKRIFRAERGEVMGPFIRTIGILIAGIALLAGAGPVGAHEGEEKRPPDAVTAVRQALAFLEAMPPNLAEANERLEWAEEAKDQAGVDIDLVKQATAVLRAKDAVQARVLLRQALAAPTGTSAAQSPGEIAGRLVDRGVETAAPYRPGAPLEALTERFRGSAGDYAILALAVVLGLTGSVILRRV